MATEAAVVRPSTAFWRTLTRYESAKVVPEIAVRNTIGFAAAIILGTIFGSPGAGVLAGIGALNVSYSDGRDPYVVRARRMLISAALCASAVTLGALSGHSNATAVITATLWAFASGMLVALGTTAGDLGVITLVTVVVFAARPLPPLEAAEAGLTAFGGALLLILLSIALWPIRRYEPERRIISSLYDDLAKMARYPAPPLDAPPLTSQITSAHEALALPGQDHSEEAERLVFLLNQAERIRLAVLALMRLRRRLAREPQGHEAASALARVLESAADTLETIARCSLAGKAAGKPEEFTQTAREFRKRRWSADSSFHAALLRDAEHQIDALGGQLRTASGVASVSVATARAHEPWRLRFSGRLAKLQANLSLDSTVFRHALRMAICLGVGDALGRAISLQRTYWIPMTIAIVLKPDFTATLSRGVLRILGTFAGLILATALFHYLHTGVAADIALMTVFIFLLRWVGAANYGIFVTALSAMIVLLISTTGVAPKEVIVARAINTAVGGTLAMLAYAIWPTWEKTQVGPALADVIEAYRKYFRAVISALENKDSDSIDPTRAAARRARSNAEASVDRLSGEPGISSSELAPLTAILVNSHRFVQAVMALEAGIYTTQRVPPRAATLRFAEMVEQTLEAVAVSLRARRALPRERPDLRQGHNEIVNSIASPAERYALVNVETDRITTSLNTLAEQVSLWVSLAVRRTR